MSSGRPRTGRQLSELLYLVGGGRAALPAGPQGSVTPDDRQGRVRAVVSSFGPRGAVQVDGTTCGSAALVVTAAAGDRDIARRLTSPGAFDLAQLAVKAASTRRALAGLRWPGALGTPPWSAAQVARFGDLTYTHRLVVDSRPSQSLPLIDLAVAWARSGVPVLLYTGGRTGKTKFIVYGENDNNKNLAYAFSCPLSSSGTKQELSLTLGKTADLSGGISSAQRDSYYTIPTGTNFLVLDLRNMTIRAEKK